MEWIQANWFWLLVIILFGGMHMRGHGHGGHSKSKAHGPQHGGGEEVDPDDRDSPRGGHDDQR
ncbi:MAG: hypothetical protein BMS9Abin29_0357 [Gemmatimonadota bacterium]|nr:MAG: hypothetical protein BMS9Abin29_0357 [Gemmatimonadota bacterium]